ncbi:MAG TPA: DUF4126 domain-containing protein [Marmoricola sp.]|nr:DUF4126 domain-containing protein [Nocardioidaceae bacterium]MCB8993624.1 DUF4126 domain-containing protein [Nocardioidaceae bacterium]MCO5324530.1 DUF4126 domain-containing protein [Nocardioidaceae bacterium]HRV69451.1 DUF4126 domain-containing protein [Marmoricola sp.]
MTNLIPLVFSSGWASGVNAYLVVLVLGLADRFGDFTEIPDILARTDVLIGAGLLYVMEFVADKVPYIDSAWDTISTFVRPTVAAAIAVAIGTHQGTSAIETIGLAGLGGGTAFASHSVKAGSRLAVNSSPEPVSNLIASLAEDGLVVCVMVLLIHHPWIALAITLTLLIAGLGLLWWLMGKIRRGWRRWKGRPIT